MLRQSYQYLQLQPAAHPLVDKQWKGLSAMALMLPDGTGRHVCAVLTKKASGLTEKFLHSAPPQSSMKKPRCPISLWSLRETQCCAFRVLQSQPVRNMTASMQRSSLVDKQKDKNLVLESDDRVLHYGTTLMTSHTLEYWETR